MLNSIILFSIRQKIFVGFLLLCMIGWGVYSLTQLPIDAVPDITNNQVQVITQSPNLAPFEIEKYITTPIELSTSNIPGLIEARSISRFGLSVVTLVFTDEVDVYWARTQVNERLKAAQELIPAGMASPSLAPVSTGLSEIFQYTLTVDPKADTSYSLMDLRTIQDWIVRRELMRVRGVADVSSFGGLLKQYQVKVNPELLKSTNISLEELFKALENGSDNTGAAYIEKGDKAFFIRGIGMTQTPEDIGNTVVKNNEGVPVLVKDIAHVEYGSSVRYGALSSNGKGETAGGVLLMLKGENASRVILRVKDKIAEIEKILPRGIIIEAFLDRESLVSRAINTVTKNLIEGGLIVIFVLVLMLGNLRAGIIVASIIPLSMLFAFSMMVLFGVSGNLMSLGAIDFGLIVDGAVIIVEIVVRKIAEKSQHLNKVLNKEEFELTIYEGSSEIMRSATFGQFIILIVYIPILAFTGIEGKMFKPMALTVIFALAGAFLLSLTYVPMISALFLKHRISEKETFADKLMRKMKGGYLPALNWSLKNQKTIVIASIVMLAFSVFLFTKLGGEFIPVLNEGDYAIECRMLPGTSLSQSLSIAKKIEKTLLDSFPDEIKKCVSKVGTSEIPTDPMPFEAFDAIVTLKDRALWKRASNKEELDVLLERTLADFPGIIFSIQQPIQMRFNELMTSAKTEVVLKLFGNDLHQLSETANEIAAVIGKIEGASDIQVQKVEGLPQIQIEYLRPQLASYGITVRQVNDVIQTAFAGKVAKLIFEQEKSFELVVKFDDAHRKDIEDLKELMLQNPYGEKIPLKELAIIKIVNGPAEISRENAKRRINIGFNSRGRDIESIVEDLRKEVDKTIKLPYGYTLVYGGEFENLAHAKQRLSIVLPIALVVIFLLLYFSFGSVKQGLLILSAVPLAAAGGVFSLWLRDMPFSISAGIGFIALFGVAVLNGIVLISYLNQLEQEGYTDLDKRIHKGLGDRFRPVVMTALVASLGFLPMAISHGPGAEIQRPLATVVVGGLISATLLKLIVLPVLYAMTQKKIKTKILSLLLIGFFSSPLFAQNPNEKSLVEKLPQLQTCIDAAVKNYPLMQASDLEILQQKALKGTVFNPPQLDVLFQVPYSKDFRPALLQAFDFPMVYVSQSRIYQQQVKIAESEKSINMVRLVKTVKDIYQNFLFTFTIRNEWKYQDSIYSLFTRNAELKYKAGDISYLDKLNAESNSALVKNQLAVSESEFANAKSQLENLTGIKFLLTDENFKIEKNNFQLAAFDSSIIETNPAVNYFKETIKLHERNLSNSRWKLAPGFTLGYFNQVEPDVPIAYNIQYGLRIPIFFWTYTSKIKYEKLGVKHEQLKLELAKRNLNSQYAQAMNDYLSNLRRLEFYESSGSKQAEEILRTAQKSFNAGEISYFNFIINIDKAFRLRTGFIETMHQYNLSVNQIQYLKGEIK